MPKQPLTIWCNAKFGGQALRSLHEGVEKNKLIFPVNLTQNNLTGGDADHLLETADVAFGQPDGEQVARLKKLQWVHLTSAGYTRYDRPEILDALKKRDAVLTNSSAVYADPCAEHVFAMMMAVSRQLPACLAEQLGDRGWRSSQHRVNSRLLRKQSILIVGYGSIAERLVELLKPFDLNIYALRRNPTGNEEVKIISPAELEEFLPRVDHVLNILPDNSSTRNYFNAERIALIKRRAAFYNIGRGTTVDQEALISALNDGSISAAYLDVTDPEPLPRDHPLWSARNCYITPHTAGGHFNEFERLVKHFLNNLDRFLRGKKMKDRVV